MKEQRCGEFHSTAYRRTVNVHQVSSVTPAVPSRRTSVEQAWYGVRTVLLLGAVCVPLIGAPGCATGPQERPADAVDNGSVSAGDAESTVTFDAGGATAAGELATAQTTGDPRVVKLGTGEFVQPPQEPWSVDPQGRITLNFDNADLRQVVKIIMRDILGQNYIIDPQVKGTVTIQTSRPLARSGAWAVLETVLQINGAALIRDDATPRIVPLANAVHVAPPASVSGNDTRRGAGFGIEIVPLQFVSARDVAENLEALSGPGSSVRVDDERNLLILAGPRHSLRRLLDTVTIFDVDWLRGLSFALLPLTYVSPETLLGDLRKIIGDEQDSVLSGMVRLEAVERLNALLVVSKQPHYIAEIEQLVTDLDQGASTPGRQLHVYQLENTSAEYIAGVLEQLFSSDQEDQEDLEVGRRPPQVRPNVPAVMPAPVGQPRTPKPPESTTASSPAAELAAAAAPAATGETAEPINIIADKRNNALLIRASGADYRAVVATIRQLDTRPRQVLIEATIAEVTLSDNLQYGVQWFLKGTADDYTLLSGLSSTTSAELSGAAAPGFFFSAADAVGDVRFLFDLLANESELKVLSAPQVLVVDNETASIRVGDQIPVVTRQSSGVGDADSPIINEIQYRDTGVLLQVTPRINEGGLVSMEISQETSEPSADVFAAGNVAILQRTIESSVAVRSSETILLGGLIRESKTNTLTGIPGLMSLPLIGPLFSRTVDGVSRTELIVTITPTVITDQDDADRATAELRRRFESIQRWLDEFGQ
jgi:general secretion pathway protein D